MLVPPDQRAERRRHGKWGQLHLSSADGLYDADGQIIAKHKGEEGAVIPWNETFGDD